MRTAALSPNTRLGMALAELNRRRIQRKLESSPRYAARRDALTAGLLGCRPLPIAAGERQSVHAALVAENEDRHRRLGELPGGPGGGPLDIEELNLEGPAAEVRYVARALGVPSDDWSLAFEEGALSAYDGVLVPAGEQHAYLTEDLLHEMLREAARTDRALRDHFAERRAFPDLPFGTRLDLPLARRACPLLLQRTAGTPLP